MRYDQREPDGENPDQMGFFEGLACKYRVFLTNLNGWSVADVVAFYSKRAAVENLIKESNSDAGTNSASVGDLGDEREPFSVEHVGLQPELLAGAVSTGGNGDGSGSNAPDDGHDEAADAVSGGTQGRRGSATEAITRSGDCSIR